MNSLKKSQLIITLLINQFIIYSQINPNTLLPNVMPHNPQAFQFTKYGEIPVQEYTGTPDISIPIYTIKTKALDIPITLKYHANGIKVNEEASWVGLGWNLSTDMEIVQTVQGLDDYGYYKNRTLPNFDCLIPLQTGGLTASSVMSTCGTFYLGLDDYWNQDHSECEFNTLYMAGLKDTEPDIFYFSAAGYSGKFILDWSTGLFKCLTDKNVKVESDVDGINNTSLNLPFVFSITFADGNRFQFQLKESTKINVSTTLLDGVPASSYVNPVNEISSRTYKLIKIMTSKADVVDFEYEQTAVSKNYPYINLLRRNEIADPPSNSTFNDCCNMDDIPLLLSPSFSPPNYTSIHFNSISYNATEQAFSFLKKITYNNEIIDFITSSRIDLKEAKKLNEVKVSCGNTYKRFLFNYDYFDSELAGNNWDSFLTYGSVNPYECNKTQDEIIKRLKLVSLNEINEKPYEFIYNTQSLPKKTSYALDYWGFYNGFHSNISFLPNIYKFNIMREDSMYYDIQNNNNSPVLNYCKASTLEKIIYPTGGYSTFDYELNTFSNYKVPSANVGQTEGFHLTTVPNPNNITQKAVLIEGGNTIFNAYGLLSTQGCYPQYPNAYQNCYFKVIHFKKELIDYIKNNSIYNYNLNTYGLMYVLGVNLDFLDGNPSNPALYNSYKDYENSIIKTVSVIEDEWIVNRKINLSEGIALFSVSGGCGTYSPTANNNWSQSSITISYNDYKPFSLGDSYGAGLRIKSITSSPAICNGPSCINNTTKKVYEYEGGKLMSPLLFFNKTRVSYTDHRIVAFTPMICASPYALSQLSHLNQELDKQYTRYKDIPNKKEAKEIEEINTALLNLTSFNDCGVTPIWVLMKNFVGYRNELHSQSYIQPSTSASGRYVGYDKVTVKDVVHHLLETSPQYAEMGKTINYYENYPDIGAPSSYNGSGYYTEINLPLMVHYPENGLLRKTELYNKNNVLKKSIINNYLFNQEVCSWGVKTLSTEVFEVSNFMGYHKKNKYLVGAYPIKAGKTVFTSSIIKDFDGSGEITTIKNFLYDSHNQVSKITETNSKSETVETNFKYPYDLSSPSYNTYNGMVIRNMIAPVVEKSLKVGQNTVSLEQSEYKWISTPNTNNYFQFTYALDKIKFAKSGVSSDLKDIVEFHEYDKYSNPTEVSMKDGTRTSYIWGYNGKYIIAKIENASQPNFINVTQGLTIINSSLMLAAINTSNTGTEAQLITALNDLRNSLPQAMITTLTHKPLVGVSSITDPKGDTTTFVYDSFNRLKEVKDKNGNKLSENEYHFRP